MWGCMCEGACVRAHVWGCMREGACVRARGIYGGVNDS